MGPKGQARQTSTRQGVVALIVLSRLTGFQQVDRLANWYWQQEWPENEAERQTDRLTYRVYRRATYMQWGTALEKCWLHKSQLDRQEHTHRGQVQT